MKKLKLLFQENEFDCGIASVAMVYNAVYNKEQSLDYFKNFFPNKKDGLTLKEIEHCSISLGLTFNSFSSTIEEIKQTIKKQYVIALINKEDVFHGRAIELLERLEDKYYVSEKVVRSQRWPTTAKGVVNHLDRLQESLEIVGIYYEKSKDRTNKTFVTISKHNQRAAEYEFEVEDDDFDDSHIDLNSFKDKF
jgi:1-aminocyclopropane-1-carboxylate deaminase/D-cysteine desulfhydrase-like pyridoxal-dependent ACC family enzyme